MEESNSSSKRKQEIENDPDSPDKRAYKVLDAIRKNSTGITDWDMICFSVEFLAMMHSVYPWLEGVARQATKLVYIAHYNDRYSDSSSFGSDKGSNERESEAGKEGTQSQDG